MIKRLLSLLALFASPVLACQLDAFSVIPSRPTNLEPVSLALAGSCPDACVPSGERISIDGKTIRIDYPSPGGCVLVPASWSQRAELGRLAAGTYEVVIGYRDRVMSRQSLTIEDASSRPFEVLPSFGARGTEVWLRGAPGCPGSTCASKGVRFNGVEASSLRATNDGLFATVPALAAEGPVDVSVVSPDGSLLTSRGAFEYTTRFDGNDYARVLFPITYAGPGANGSQWVSENIVSNGGPVPIPTIPSIWFAPVINFAPPAAIPGRDQAFMPTESSDGGALLLVPRELMQFVDFASHIRDTSRAAENLGTEIPVVLEEDTASEVRIVGIPGDARYRPRLRVYDIDANESPVAIRVVARNGATLANATLVPRRSFVCITTPCEDVAFLSYDFPASLPTLPNAGPLEVVVSGAEDRRLWAFVSLTNNETQQVTTYSP